MAGGRYYVNARDGATSSCDGNELLAAGSGADGNRAVGAALVLVLLLAGGVMRLVRRTIIRLLVDSIAPMIRLRRSAAVGVERCCAAAGRRLIR